jgi:hypothetical protein
MARERRETARALEFLAPLFGLKAVPPMPRLRRGEKSFQSTQYEPKRTGGMAVTVRRFSITYDPCPDPDTIGEEAGHYLHAVANQPLEEAIHEASWPPTEAAARDYLRLRNWEECIGGMAGTLYAAHCRYRGVQNMEWAQAKRRECRHLEGRIGDWRKVEPDCSHAADHIRELQGRYDEYEWSLLEHVPGYRAALGLLQADPFGSRMQEYARYGPDEALRFLDGLRSWRRYWSVLERSYAGRFLDVILKNEPGVFH